MNPIFRNFDYDTRATMLDKLKRKQKSRQKTAMFERLALTDPTGDVSITPIPRSPAEPAPNGMLDGIYPQEDRESKPVSSLDYGILETHMADDGAGDELPEVLAPEVLEKVEWLVDNTARTNAWDTCVEEGISRPHDDMRWDEVYRDTLEMALDEATARDITEGNHRPITLDEAKAIAKQLLARA